MLPQRLSVKFFIQEVPEIDPARLIPIFQRWIQRRSVEGILIDVADYKHVPGGPGVILIGHEGDYSFDLKDGRPGLVYTRKRGLEGGLQDYLRTVFHPALGGAQKLAQDGTIGALRFTYSDFEITFLDKLRTPNTTDTFDVLTGGLLQFVGELYHTGDVQIERRTTDARYPLAVRIAVVAPDIRPAELLRRLDLTVTVAG